MSKIYCSGSLAISSWGKAASQLWIQLNEALGYLQPRVLVASGEPSQFHVWLRVMTSERRLRRNSFQQTYSCLCRILAFPLKAIFSRP